MKRLYTYSDFVHNSIKESQDINSNMEVFALNEMQTEWTLEETKSMYAITKDNIYQKLKEKFEQRIDIILTGDEDVYSKTRPGGTGTYYQKKMSETCYGNKTYGDYSKIIKDDWDSKVFSKLTSLPDPLQQAYDDLAKLGKIKFDARLNIKNSYDLQKRAYDKDAADKPLPKDLFIHTGLTEPAYTLICTFVSIYDYDNTNFYKSNTDNIFSENKIDTNRYIDDFNKNKGKDPENPFPLKDFHKTIKKEFFEYYRHYHFWLFANLIMNGKTNTVLSSTSTKPKSSTSSVTTPTRERRTVDRVSVGQTISDL